MARYDLTEYGEVLPKGRAGLKRDIPGALERVSERLPTMVVDSLRDQRARVAKLDEEITAIERRLTLWHKSNEASLVESALYPAWECSVLPLQWQPWATAITDLKVY